MNQQFPDTDNNLTKSYLAEYLVNRLVNMYVQDNLGVSPKTFLEPGCGEIAPFAKAAKECSLDLETTAIEYRKVDNPTIVTEVDFFNRIHDDKWRKYFDYDIIATNPSFSKGKVLAFIRRSLDLLNDKGCMGFLLGLNFLASRERMLLYQERPPYEVVVITHRPSFIRFYDGKVGTDSREYGFFIWKGKGTVVKNPIISWCNIRDPDKRAIKNRL